MVAQNSAVMPAWVMRKDSCGGFDRGGDGRGTVLPPAIEDPDVLAAQCFRPDEDRRLEVVRLVVTDELDPLGGLGAQVAVDDVDDPSGVGATMDQITDLDDDQILGQRAVGARAEAGELVAQWFGVSTDVTDDGDPHRGQVAFRRAGRGEGCGAEGDAVHPARDGVDLPDGLADHAAFDR